MKGKRRGSADRSPSPSWRSWLRRTPTWVELAGLFVAVAAIVIPLVVTGGGSSAPDSSSFAGSETSPPSGEGGEGAPQPAAELEVDSFIASDGTIRDPHPKVEVIVHNVGKRRAVIDGALVTVKAVYQLDRCAPQGNVPLSATYGLVLPHKADPSESLEHPLHDQVAPDGVDRFAIALSTHLAHHERPGQLSAENEAEIDFLYQLQVAVKNDSPTSPLALGAAWVSLPSAPVAGEYFWSPGVPRVLKEYVVPPSTAAEVWGRAMPCWRRNTAILRRTLRTPGVRSPLLKYATKNLIEPSLAKLE